MKSRIVSHRLLDTSSALALAAVATLASASVQPASAVQGIRGGGASLPSLVFRQIFDFYRGSILPGDGYTFSPLFNHLTPTPGLLPPVDGPVTTVTGLYASVGSGNGLRAYISNSARQLLRGPNTTTVTFPTTFSLPATLPPFRDSTPGSAFGTYPYPRLDYAASEAPLPANLLGPTGTLTNTATTVSFGGFTPTTNWQTVLTITATTTTPASYNRLKSGQPIQVPAFEVPVAIGVNVATTTAATWTIRSALTPTTAPGSAIQLSSAQLCAIFSGNVRAWNSGKLITLRKTTLVGGVPTATLTSEPFYASNTNATIHTGVPYTNNPLPIRVSYRSDGSGTTFVFTNYLATVCPLLDNGSGAGTPGVPANNYTKIFTGVGRTAGATANLPGTSFKTLIDNIKTVTGVDVTVGTGAWIGGSGNPNVAANISTSGVNSGRIGYVSADFSRPYATTVTGDAGTVPSPRSARVQNENLRANRVDHPGDTGAFTTAQNFIAPTPDSTGLAWLQLTPPSASATFNDWNVYNQVWPTGTPLSGGLNIVGKGKLPLTTRLGAYSLTGTSFLDVYSCYADVVGPPNRVAAITNWLSWVFGGSVSSLAVGTPATSTASSPKYDPDFARILRNNGFHELPASFATTALNTYIRPTSTKSIAAFIPSGSQVRGCTGVTGGGAN